MRMPNGSERLIAAKLGMGTMEVLAQQDLPTDAGTQKPGSQTQVDFAVKQLTNKLGERTAIAADCTTTQQPTFATRDHGC